ncbi:MAG TPA: hypothetical protein VJ727_07575 [Rhodanobacteraceae bacterium]|nr:hypothetical protein [Rhodanobacteraceae bacterium]
MAQINESPAIDPAAGAAALEEDLPRVLRMLGATSIEELGWSRPNKLTLLIPISGVHQGNTDDYLLRLGFHAYRTWPPSAQFVNPETLSYSYPQDQHFVPQLTSGECRTHVAYPHGTNKIQLICCSATLEFYEIKHNVAQEHLWSETNNFWTTVNAIKRAMASFYQGPFPKHGQ